MDTIQNSDRPGRDLRETTPADGRIRQSDGQYRALFENMIDGFAYHRIVLDETGLPVDYIFLEANEGFANLTGLDRSAIIGKRVTEVLPGLVNDPDGWIRKYCEVALHGKGSRFEQYSPMLNKWFSVSAYSPRPGYFATVLKDITESKIAEQEHERLAEELKIKNRELEQVVFVASHDLRSPLVNVQGFSNELEISIMDLVSAFGSDDIPRHLKEKAAPILLESIPEALRFIKAGIAKMDSLLSGLLKVARIGRTVVHSRAIDMNSLLPGIAAALEFQIKEAGAMLTIEDVPSCLGDETQISQVFLNLLENAAKYLDPSRMGCIKISGSMNGAGRAVYCVSDNGVGIAPEHHEKIFEIFHRLDPEKGTGEGLGLAIVRRILDKHRGRVWVESEFGRGARFFVDLPAV